MTHEEASDLVSRITYKNFNIMCLRDVCSDMLRIRFSQTVPNATLNKEYSLSEPTIVASAIMLDPEELKRMDKENFVAQVYHQLVACEMHEMKEWFKLDGVCVYDPHPEPKNDYLVPRADGLNIAETKSGSLGRSRGGNAR